VSSVPTEFELAANGTTGVQPAWKRELNDKIAAARARRQGSRQDAAPSAEGTPDMSDAKVRASRVAAAVAARYAQAPSYSEYLASEVRAAMLAAVEAQAAANQARATADALYAEFQTPETVQAALISPPQNLALPMPVAQPMMAHTPPAQTPAVRTHGKPAAAAPAPARVDHAASGFHYTQSPPPAPVSRVDHAPAAPVLSDPVEDALVTPSTPLPAKLIEFPRELIAARKARPRHAEGPLRDDAQEEPGQLRIFEVEPGTISTTAEIPQATEWSSIRLNTYPDSYLETDSAVTPAPSSSAYTGHVGQSQSQLSHNRYRNNAMELDSPFKVAGLADRLMAGIVDAALVGIAFVTFVFVFAASTVHPPTGKPAVIGGALVLACLYLLYQLLFFTYADATPGMRYARIALCTFDDDNPTREAMRKRIFALVLAAAPLGLGFLYALFDENHLGWHDRMTRMYQRSYK
jgi:uncharacterized RDD family membrane protein YckC